MLEADRHKRDRNVIYTAVDVFFTRPQKPRLTALKT